MESTAFNRSFAIGGYLSFWSACYVGGCTLLAGVLLGADRLVLPVVTAFLIAMQVYAMHRLRRAASYPGTPTARSTYIVSHRRVLMASIMLSSAGAVVTAWFVHPLAEVFVFGAPVGAVVYAIGQPGRQVRDMLVVKNVMVSAAISVLATGLVLLGSRIEPMSGSVLAVGLFLAGVVFGDAMLCDIDDTEPDARTSTRTVPRIVGTGRTLQVVNLVAVIVTAGMIVVGLVDWVPLELAVIYPGLLLASLLVAQRMVSPGAWRNIVDTRLPMCVVIGWVLVILVTSSSPA